MPQATPSTPQTADWKSELAGLSIPPEPSAWPPSWAAVLLTLAVIFVLLLAVRALIRRYQSQAWRREAMKELDRIQEQEDVIGLSRLLRRVARHRFGPQAASRGDAAFAKLFIEAPSFDISIDLAEDLACCAHRPAFALSARHFEAAKQWIRGC